MSISALNASNNLVDLKSDKVAPVYTWEYCRRLPHDIHTYGRVSSTEFENTQQNTSFNSPPPGDLPQTRSNDRPSRVSPSYGRRITQATAEMLQLHSIPADAAAPCSRRNASKLQTRSLILYSALRALRGTKRDTTFEKNASVHNVRFLRTDAIYRLTTFLLLISIINI